jgi:hypothetical protein
MGFGSAISVFISLFEKPSVTPLAIAFFGSSLISFIILKLGSRRIKTSIENSATVVVGH